jgi:hypothetical protein
MLKDMYNMYSSIGCVEMRVIESSECMPFVEQPFHSGTDWKGEVTVTQKTVPMFGTF